MSTEREPRERREVDGVTTKVAYRSALESLDLTAEELLLGKADEEGEIVWSGCPRWLVKHPRTMPTVEGIVEDIFDPDAVHERDGGT